MELFVRLGGLAEGYTVVQTTSGRSLQTNDLDTILPFGGTRARSHVSLRRPHFLHSHRHLLRSKLVASLSSLANSHATQPSCSIMKDRQWNSEVNCVFALYTAPLTYADSYMCNCSTRLTKLSVNTAVECFFKAVIAGRVLLSFRPRLSVHSTWSVPSRTSPSGRKTKLNRQRIPGFFGGSIGARSHLGCAPSSRAHLFNQQTQLHQVFCL